MKLTSYLKLGKDADDYVTLGRRAWRVTGWRKALVTAAQVPAIALWLLTAVLFTLLLLPGVALGVLVGKRER